MLFLIQPNVIQRFVNRACSTKRVKMDVRFAGTQSTQSSAENSCASPMNTWTAQRYFRRYFQENQSFSLYQRG